MPFDSSATGMESIFSPTAPSTQIFYNIVGGAIVSALTWLVSFGVSWARHNIYRRRFRSVFGEDSAAEFFLVYGRLQLLPSFDEHGVARPFPYVKPETGSGFRISGPVPFPETKGAKYVSETFGEVMGNAPRLTSDVEIAEKLDCSFCAFGLLSNLKSMQAMRAGENIWFTLDLPESGDGSIVLKAGEPGRFTIGGEFDYGLILAITPKVFPQRRWFVAGGLGEAGTSGAAWFLAKNWRLIQKLAKGKSAGFVVRVRSDSDESAELVYPLSTLSQKLH